MDNNTYIVIWKIQMKMNQIDLMKNGTIKLKEQKCLE